MGPKAPPRAPPGDAPRTNAPQGEAKPANAKPGNPPSPTLYLSNLDDKIHKTQLKRQLYFLFTRHGSILDIVNLKTAKMRGQAHIVFKDVQSSTAAMRALQGFNFLGREMHIQYAKGRSKIFAKLKGEFEQVDRPTDQPSKAEPRSIFDAPPPSTQPTLPKKIVFNDDDEKIGKEAPKSPKGVKRDREPDDVGKKEEEKEESSESESEGGEASMEEDDSAMEESEGED